MTRKIRRPTFSPHEVAALLGAARNTVRKTVSQGHVKGVLVGSQRRFTFSEVRRAIAERMLGHKPRNSRETSEGMIQWARERLATSGDVSRETRPFSAPQGSKSRYRGQKSS